MHGATAPMTKQYASHPASSIVPLQAAYAILVANKPRFQPLLPQRMNKQSTSSNLAAGSGGGAIELQDVPGSKHANKEAVTEETAGTAAPQQ
jgi:hypothetical protein